MSTTENGWTNKFPDSSGGIDHYYFVRRKDRNDCVIMGFSMGKAWLNGVPYEQSEMRSHLFLGPLQPEDFEQLAALREVGDKVVQAVEFALTTPGMIRGRNLLEVTAAALREALGDK